jgi:type I restriction enzyme S subunit
VLKAQEDFDARFLNYQLHSTHYLAEITARSKAMPPAQFDLPWEQFRTLPVASPQLSLQRRFADYLDRETACIDALITKKQRMIELFKERRTTVISSAVLGNAHFDSSTRGVGPWPRVKLRHVARFAYGDSLAAEERLAGPVRVFGSNGQVDVHDWPNTLGPVLVVGRKGSYGKIHHSTDPVFAIDTTYFVDASTTQHNLRWLYYVLSTLGLDLLSQDVGVPGLSRESAYEQRLSLPSPAEQGTIADYLDRETARIDIITGTLERQIDLLRERRQALITAAVTGELDVAGVAA